VISGSILGVGMSGGVGGVRWILARRIVLAWILTIPVSAAFAAVSYLIVSVF
jgi:PiT family inorganic phosphate transporter